MRYLNRLSDLLFILSRIANKDAGGDVLWTPADWAWTGGLMDALLPTLYFGRPIVASRGRFSAEHAFRLMEKYRVTNSFLFPTALKMMMKSVAEPRSRYALGLPARFAGAFFFTPHRRRFQFLGVLLVQLRSGPQPNRHHFPDRHLHHAATCASAALPLGQQPSASYCG